jgi:ribosomal protein L21E
MTTFEDVVAFIGKEADLSQLNQIDQLVTHAKRGKAMSLPIGTRVRTVDLKPKYLTGLTGTVKGHQGDRVLVETDVPYPRFGNPMRLPAATVVPI